MAKLITDKYKPSDTLPVHEFVEEPKIVPKDYQTAIVDNRTERLDTLVRYVNGSRAKVIYFRQRLSKDDSVSHFSLDTSATHQQYERIDGFEIIMQSGLSVSNSGDDTRGTEITGEAYVLQPIIPNVGDIFLMDFGRGTLGWMNVVDSRRLSHRRNTLYEVQFSMAYEIVDQINDPKILNLNKKVVEVFKYSHDYLVSGQNPLITPEMAYDLESFLGTYNKLRSHWFRKFYSRFYETCFIPNQTLFIYDGFFMKAIQKWFSTRDVAEMIYFKVYNDEEFPLFKVPSLWDAITEQDTLILKEAFTKAVPLSVKSFTNVGNLNQIRFSSFQGVIVPTEHTYTNEIWLKQDNIIGNALPINPTIRDKPQQTYQDIPLINPVSLARSYVLSPQFYRDDVEGQSHLELQLWKYLEDNTLDIDVLKALIKDYPNWGEMEQYYYIPILMILINYGTRRR